jgi:hypothetical protein
LTTILQDESRSPQPHPCLSFAADFKIYETIGSIGSISNNEGVIREAFAVFGALIDSEEEEFLSSSRFAESLMSFVIGTPGGRNIFISEETSSYIIELLFGIAAKIRLQPEVLPVWFKDTEAQKKGPEDSQTKSVGRSSETNFPLCFQFVQNMHSDGRIGDFARTGLLYIFETASRSAELENWILGSDLTAIMASATGALYSQLSRKLSIIHPKDNLPVILQLSDYAELEAPRDADSLYSDASQKHLETYLSHLTFWQDILEHCTSADVKSALLDRFEDFFLTQLLFPSLVQSSDIDGGSSVAVMTYLRRMLEVLDNVELVDLILRYLLAIPRSRSSANLLALNDDDMSKSMLLKAASSSNANDDGVTPLVFSLADLIQNYIRSTNPQTVIAALRLCTVIINKDHTYAANTLISINTEPRKEFQRTLGSLNAELETYLQLAEALGGEAGVNDAYDAHVQDAQRHVEIHACSINLLSLNNIKGGSDPVARSVAWSGQRPLVHHWIQSDDRFMRQLLLMLGNFFTNNIETNLSLTDAIVTLASCPRVHLDDWMSVDPAQYQYSSTNGFPAPDEDDDSAAAQVQRLKIARRQPTWRSEYDPSLLRTIKSLQKDIAILKSVIPSLSQLINTRKQAFRLHEEIQDAILNSPPPMSARRSSENPPRSPTPQKSISSRLFSRTGSPSRLDSPRGRSPGGAALSPGPTSSPSRGSTTRSLFSSPARETPSRQRLLSADANAPPIVVGHTPQDLLHDIVEGANSEVLARKITFPLEHELQKTAQSPPKEAVKDGEPPAKAAAEAEEDESDDLDSAAEQDDSEVLRVVSLSHVMTNIVILQEFVLELAAVMQVRASMFGEVSVSGS